MLKASERQNKNTNQGYQILKYIDAHELIYIIPLDSVLTEYKQLFEVKFLKKKKIKCYLGIEIDGNDAEWKRNTKIYIFK